MQRPAGITVIVVLDFIGGAFCALIALLAFAGGSMIASFLSQAGAGMGSGIAGGVVMFAGVVLLAVAALVIITAVGLLKLKGWARIIQLVLTALGLLNSVRGFASGFHMQGSAMAVTIVVIAYDVWVLWYMFTPGVKQAFSGPPQPQAQPS